MIRHGLHIYTGVYRNGPNQIWMQIEVKVYLYYTFGEQMESKSPLEMEVVMHLFEKLSYVYSVIHIAKSIIAVFAF